MTLAPSLFPSIGWMYLYIQQNGEVNWDSDIYQKQSIRNRYRIAGSNGIQVLTIPVNKFSQGELNAEITINYAENWQRIHSKALESSYGKSPFYEFFEADLQNIFTTRYIYLQDFQKKSIEFLLHWMAASVDGLRIESKIKKVHFFSQSIDIEDKTGVCRNLDLNPYPQVFEDKWGFIPHLSTLDLLCNEGPESLSYLLNLPLLS